MSILVTNSQLSVCVPVYNGAEFLHQCLESLIKQTFIDFEVVLSDDSSTDETVRIAEAFAARDRRFRVIRNDQRLGLVGNWNRCLHLAQGQWIKFLFQDDYLMPECLRRMLAQAEQTNALFVTCQRDFAFESGVDKATRMYYREHAAIVDKFFAGRSFVSPDEISLKILDDICLNFIGEPTTTLLNREVFRRYGLFNPNLIMCCDSEYWWRVGSQCGVSFVPEVLAAFRVHHKSTSAENFDKRRFRTHLLDPLIIAHELAFGPTYVNIRRIAADRKGPNFLADLCRELGLKAFWDLRRTGVEKPDEAVACNRELDVVLKAYPRIANFIKPRTLKERVLSRLRRAVRQRKDS